MATRERATNRETGFILVTCLMLLAVVSSLVATYMVMSTVEFGTVRGTKDSASGFNAAEAGLNIRAEVIRDKFLGYNTPTGTSPTSTAPCEGSNQGTGDFACQTHNLGKQTATSYVNQLTDPANPPQVTIPPGELYQNLNAIEYSYDVQAVGKSVGGDTEAILNLRFKSLLIPLFQFAVFYNKDLEILPGPSMTINGPIATNGNLYKEVGGGASLRVDGQVSTAGDYYRGRKNDNSCAAGTVQVKDPSAYRTVVNGTASRKLITQASLTPWNGMIQTRVSKVTVPAPEDLNPTPGKTYWDKADIRLVMRLTAANVPDFSSYPSAVEIRKADNSVDAARSLSLNNSCAGALPAFGIQVSGSDGQYRPANYTNKFYNNREGSIIQMMDIDLQLLFNCIKVYDLLDKLPDGTSRLLSDTTEGGLVFHLSVSGPNSAAASSKYGIRVRNGQELKATVAGSPAIVGLTIVTDQAFYVMGNYNSTNKKPAAFLVDTFNVLSSNWTTKCPPPNECASGAGSFGTRVAAATTVNAAVLAATTSTGNADFSDAGVATAGQGGAYNGGLENYPRFQENWSGIAFNYTGSLVSLNKPQHSTSGWVYGSPVYNAPNRNWAYDTMFNDASKLPPLCPRFVYLRQQLFVRDYEISG